MDCVKCARKGIKYRCIGCKSPICNVCSTPCTDETPGYSEETYCVGKCDECQHGHKRKLPDQPTAAKSQQSSLSFYFTKRTKTSAATTEAPVSSQQQLPRDFNPLRASTETKVGPLTAVSATPSAKKTRALTVAAANRWKTTSLADHLGSEWLVINADKGDHVISLNCSVCKAHADKLKGMKNFSTAWAFTGSTNLRLSNAEDHARGEPHKRALDLHLKGSKGQSAFERAESMKASNDAGQQLVTSGIKNMQSADFAKTKTKFETAYFIAKEEMPLLKYPQILKLEEKHGADIGTAYRNRQSCTNFINCIGEELGKRLQEKISGANFFSVLTDGSEDASVSEKEAIFVQYLEKNPPGKDTIEVVTAFLRLVNIHSQNTFYIYKSQPLINFSISIWYSMSVFLWLCNDIDSFSLF